MPYRILTADPDAPPLFVSDADLCAFVNECIIAPGFVLHIPRDNRYVVSSLDSEFQFEIEPLNAEETNDEFYT